MDNFGIVDKNFIQNYIKTKIETLVISDSLSLTHRYVILYDIHKLTKDAIKILAHLTESFYKSSRFIVTTNTLGSLGHSFCSKFGFYRFSCVKYDPLYTYLNMIVKDNEYTLTTDEIDQIIEEQEYNIENCINAVQFKCICGSQYTFVDDIFNEIKSNILSKINMKSIRNNFYKLLICNFEGTFIIKKLYKLLYTHIDNKHKLVQSIARIEHRIIKSERVIYHLELFVYSLWNFI